jgi:heavy metal sensor kinase
MRLIPNTLAARLTVWYAAIFLLFFGFAFLSFYQIIDYTLGKTMDEDLAEDIAEFRILLNTEGIRRVETEIDREAASNDPQEIFLRLVDAAGRQTFASETSHWPNLQQVSLQHGLITENREPVFATLFGAGDDHATRVVSAPIGPGLWLQIGESTESRAEFMQLILNLFSVTFVLVVVLAAVVGWVMAKQALRGVEAVRRAAEGVANGRLESRVSVENRGAEIERLAATFNLMIGRIRALISGMRDMTDNIAHDLRSPLARIRANSELALLSATTIEEYESSAAETLEECDRLLEMINTTLDVAEAEAGATRFETEEVHVGDMVNDVCDLFSPVAEDKQIRLSNQLVSDCRVRGNRKYLQRMLANLMDNALKYTPANGTVAVAVSADERAVSIAVRDTGIGIPASEQAQIFERFFRCDQSRSHPGFGLGLSLARAVARTHGGDLAVQSNPGGGSVFTVTLPRDNQGPAFD